MKKPGIEEKGHWRFRFSQSRVDELEFEEKSQKVIVSGHLRSRLSVMSQRVSINRWPPASICKDSKASTRLDKKGCRGHIASLRKKRE